MRIVNKEIKYGVGKRKMYYEQFGSYAEYMNIVEERQKTNAHNAERNLENICKDSNWVGCKSYDEAKDLLTNGWEAKVDYLKEQVRKEIDLCDEKRVVKTFESVAGYMPIVPNAIIGLPNCMLNARVERKKSKIIKFLVLMNRSWRFDSDDIIKKMSKLLAKIAILEKHNYRCRIEIFGSFTNEISNRTIACHSVLIKSENQLFDLQRMAFPIAHSAMQRVFGFSWENSLPIDYDCYHDFCLGSSIQYWKKEHRDALIGAVKEGNEKMVVVGMETDIDKLFEKGGEIYGQ